MRGKISIAIAVILVAICAMFAYGGRSSSPAKKSTAQLGERVAPPLISKTRGTGVLIESAAVDETNNVLIVKVRNDTDKDVSDFIVEGGDETQGTHGLNSFVSRPAVAAHSTATVTFPLSNPTLFDKPVTLKSVIFADGSEAGDNDGVAAAKRGRREAEEAHARRLEAEGEKGGKK